MAESGNRDFANGQPTRSPKGALYGMQVMPATAADPGFGIAPAVDQSPGEYDRVGSQYIGKLQQHYGDPAKALAAYNWGPGNLDKAIARYGDNWMSAAPPETRAYVQRIMRNR